MLAATNFAQGSPCKTGKGRTCTQQRRQVHDAAMSAAVNTCVVYNEPAPLLVLWPQLREGGVDGDNCALADLHRGWIEQKAWSGRADQLSGCRMQQRREQSWKGPAGQRPVEHALPAGQRCLPIHQTASIRREENDVVPLLQRSLSCVLQKGQGRDRQGSTCPAVKGRPACDAAGGVAAQEGAAGRRCAGAGSATAMPQPPGARPLTSMTPATRFLSKPCPARPATRDEAPKDVTSSGTFTPTWGVGRAGERGGVGWVAGARGQWRTTAAQGCHWPPKAKLAGQGATNPPHTPMGRSRQRGSHLPASAAA